MAILYRKPKLEIFSSLKENLISLNFKLEFQPCVDVLEINLDFITQEKYDNKYIAEFDKNYIIKNLSGLGYTLDTNQKYLNKINLFLNNSDEFILDLFIKEFPTDINHYLIFSVKKSNLFFISDSNIEILIPKSNMKKLNSFEILNDYSPIIGIPYSSDGQFDINKEIFIEPEFIINEGITYFSDSEFDLSVDNNIDYSEESLPYIPLVEPNTPPEIQFDQTLITINEGEFNQNILITRTGDITQNSIIRIDIESATSTIPDDVIVYSSKYIRFFSNETEKNIIVAALLDLENESTENLIFRLTAEDNCTIGSNSQLIVEINNVSI